MTSSHIYGVWHINRCGHIAPSMLDDIILIFIGCGMYMGVVAYCSMFDDIILNTI